MSTLETPPRRRRRECGLGLIELLAGMVVGMAVIVSALGTLLLSREAAASVADLSHLQQQGAYALHVIGLQLRQAGALEALRGEGTGLFEFGPDRAQAAGTAFAVFGTDGMGTAPDKVSVAFAAGTWAKAPGQFDCSGSGVDGGERVDASFDVDAKGQLNCSGRRKQPVIQNVADFQVLYRVDTGSGIQIMDAAEVEVLRLWEAVNAVEICLDLRTRSQGPGLQTPYTDCGGNDRRRKGSVHLVFRNVFGLRTP